MAPVHLKKSTGTSSKTLLMDCVLLDHYMKLPHSSCGCQQEQAQDGQALFQYYGGHQKSQEKPQRKLYQGRQAVSPYRGRPESS
mmetsp:Transcript_10623/g.23811  ORF Transcript_10623/g.23811 Transcript_10623/m.23811 type:complete len:84 (-) Transcript_10623:710-961(-)